MTAYWDRTHLGLQPRAGVRLALLPMTHAAVGGLAPRPIVDLHPPTAMAADDQSAQQGPAPARHARGRGDLTIPLQTFLILQIILPGDIGRDAVSDQHLPFAHRDRPLPAPRTPRRLSLGIDGPPPIGVGPRVQRMADHVVDPPQPRRPKLHLAPVRALGHADGQADTLPPQ